MKFITGLFFVLCSVLAISYTSCKKDPCKGVECVNDGTCADGKCVCPTGFQGKSCENRDTTTITYKNHSFTPVTIIVNGTTTTLPVDSTITFQGEYGSSLSGSAYTYKVNDSGVRMGGKVTWLINKTFPVSGSIEETLEVPSTYFYLKINNSSTSTVTKVYVNFGDVTQSTELIAVPNNGQLYEIGYYFAYPGTVLKLSSSSNTWIFSTLNLPFTKNQTYTALPL